MRSHSETQASVPNCISLCYYCYAETPWPKAIWEEDVLFGLIFHIHSPDWHHWRKSKGELNQGRNLKAGADAELMEEHCLLACSPWLAQPVFLIFLFHFFMEHRTYGCPHPQGTGPSHIHFYIRKWSFGLPTAQSYGIFSQLLFPSLKLTWNKPGQQPGYYLKLTTTHQRKKKLVSSRDSPWAYKPHLGVGPIPSSRWTIQNELKMFLKICFKLLLVFCLYIIFYNYVFMRLKCVCAFLMFFISFFMLLSFLSLFVLAFIWLNLFLSERKKTWSWKGGRWGESGSKWRRENHGNQNIMYENNFTFN